MRKYGLIAMFFLVVFAYAEETVDTDIVKNLDFFSQLDVVQNMQLVASLDSFIN